MSKYIKNYRDKFKYILSFILLTQLQAKNYTNILHTPIKEEFSYKDFNFSESKNIEKIIKIDSVKQLFKELGIKYDLSILKDKKIDKILSDININRYTITYLVYNKVSKRIDGSNIGGEYIGLIHIKTDSKNDYKKTQKNIGKKSIPWRDIDKFAKSLNEISKTHLVTYKNIILSDETIIPAEDLNKLIINAKAFSKDIINHEIIYNNCDENRSELNIIDTYLSMIEDRNNLEYIRRNQNEFKNDIKIDKITAQSKKISKLLSHVEKNSTLKKVEIIYPQWYESFNINKPINIEHLNLPEREIEKKYHKILDNTILSLKYEFKLEIKNNGKVILLKWIKNIKESKQLIAYEENSKILLDSYINYKGLIATKINGLHYGSIIYNTKFDRYEKNETIKGFGIIESAKCGYKIKDKNGTFEFSCKDIKLKDLDIKFDHDE